MHNSDDSNAEELSDQELDEIERRARAATSGPWRSYIEGRDHLSGDSFISTGGDELYLHPPPNLSRSADQDFVAAARQDVPRLVAEVRRLRRMIGKRPRSGSQFSSRAGWGPALRRIAVLQRGIVACTLRPRGLRAQPDPVRGITAAVGRWDHGVRNETAHLG